MSNRHTRGTPANTDFVPTPEIDPKTLSTTEKKFRLDIAGRLNAAIDHCEKNARREGNGSTVKWIKETLWRAAACVLKMSAWAIAGIEKFLGWIKSMWDKADLTNRIREAWRSFVSPPLETTAAKA